MVVVSLLIADLDVSLLRLVYEPLRAAFRVSAFGAVRLLEVPRLDPVLPENVIITLL